jgi:hypothetical protein
MAEFSESTTTSDSGTQTSDSGSSGDTGERSAADNVDSSDSRSAEQGNDAGPNGNTGSDQAQGNDTEMNGDGHTGSSPTESGDGLEPSNDFAGIDGKGSGDALTAVTSLESSSDFDIGAGDQCVADVSSDGSATDGANSGGSVTSETADGEQGNKADEPDDPDADAFEQQFGDMSIPDVADGSATDGANSGDSATSETADGEQGNEADEPDDPDAEAFEQQFGDQCIPDGSDSSVTDSANSGDGVTSETADGEQGNEAEEPDDPDVDDQESGDVVPAGQELIQGPSDVPDTQQTNPKPDHCDNEVLRNQPECRKTIDPPKDTPSPPEDKQTPESTELPEKGAYNYNSSQERAKLADKTESDAYSSNVEAPPAKAQPEPNTNEIEDIKQECEGDPEKANDPNPQSIAEYSPESEQPNLSKAPVSDKNSRPTNQPNVRQGGKTVWEGHPAFEGAREAFKNSRPTNQPNVRQGGKTVWEGHPAFEGAREAFKAAAKYSWYDPRSVAWNTAGALASIGGVLIYVPDHALALVDRAWNAIDPTGAIEVNLEMLSAQTPLPHDDIAAVLVGGIRRFTKGANARVFGNAARTAKRAEIAGDAAEIARGVDKASDSADIARGVGKASDSADAGERVNRTADTGKAGSNFSDEEILEDLVDSGRGSDEGVTSDDRFQDFDNIGPKHQRLSEPSGSQALGDRMTQAGRPRPGPGYEPHHIIPENDPRASDLRDFLADKGVEIFHESNGAWLVRGGNTPNVTGATRHEFTFRNGAFEVPDEYFNALENIFSSEFQNASKQDVLDTLEALGSLLENGKIFW